MPRADVIYNILHLECLPPQHFNTEVPLPLCDIIMRLLQKNREGRYPDPQSLLQALLAVP